jgi:hypothetical protein
MSKNNKIVELALMTSVYTNALNDMEDMTSYNPSPKGFMHKSTFNKKQSSKRRKKNNQAKKSRKANRR